MQRHLKNRVLFIKPYGGLWASRVDAEYGWKEWTEDNEYRTDYYNKDNYFKFKLRDDAKILVINDVKQLDKLPKVKSKFNLPIENTNIYLDFEKLAKEYDAIEVLISEEKVNPLDFNNSLYWKLYGWDCDSILIMNKDIVEVENVC